MHVIPVCQGAYNPNTQKLWLKDPEIETGLDYTERPYLKTPATKNVAKPNWGMIEVGIMYTLELEDLVC